MNMDKNIIKIWYEAERAYPEKSTEFLLSLTCDLYFSQYNEHIDHGDVAGALVRGSEITFAWKEYENDFNAMTDDEIERETSSAQERLEEAESWLEAVASWEAAGRPRKKDD